MLNHPLYPNGNVYLSGGMQYAKDLGSSWRVECSMRLKSMGYYPIDITALDKAYSATYGHPYMFLETSDLLQYKSNIRRQIVRADVELVRQHSDALIVYFDEAARRGAGTQSECQEAYDHDVPYFVVNGYPEWKEVPGWIRANSTKMFSTFDELYGYLGRLPHGILKRDIYGNRHAPPHYLCSLCGEPFEKHGMQFVSKLSPVYCKGCVQVVKKTHEAHEDRYSFFMQQMELEIEKEREEVERRRKPVLLTRDRGCCGDTLEDAAFEIHQSLLHGD
jgi:hypothetical protein